MYMIPTPLTVAGYELCGAESAQPRLGPVVEDVWEDPRDWHQTEVVVVGLLRDAYN